MMITCHVTLWLWSNLKYTSHSFYPSQSLFYFILKNMDYGIEMESLRVWYMLGKGSTVSPDFLFILRQSLSHSAWPWIHSVA